MEENKRRKEIEYPLPGRRKEIEEPLPGKRKEIEEPNPERRREVDPEKFETHVDNPTRVPEPDLTGRGTSENNNTGKESVGRGSMTQKKAVNM